MPSPEKHRPSPAPSDRAAVRPSDRKGFTLIEVMVATAVMAIMIVMIGGLFQQASSSWDAGYVRAEGGMAVRAVVGALTRDLATAVDGRRFGLEKPVLVSDSSITMYRLFPGPGGKRDVRKVVYTGGERVTRKIDDEPAATLYEKPDGRSYGAKFSFYAGPETSQMSASSGARPYESGTGFPGEIAWTIPYVKVRCEMTRTGSFSGLMVRSRGRDGVPNGVDGDKSQDDIIVR